MSKVVVTAGWDDVPHLAAEEKARLLAGTPPYLRDARSKGIPTVGAGAIYPLPEEDIVVDDFVLPRHWPKGYGLDVGWKATAAVWGAWDQSQGVDCIYLYSEYKRGVAEPPVHVQAIRARGEPLLGAIDPASRGRGQRDGERLFQDYQDLGLQIFKAPNAVEAGLFEVWERLTTGRLKIFRSMVQTLQELRLYRRDERGHLVKENDHLMDAMRYLVMMAPQVISWHPDREPTRVVGTVNPR
jgi:hypothetical protein